MGTKTNLQILELDKCQLLLSVELQEIIQIFSKKKKI